MKRFGRPIQPCMTIVQVGDQNDSNVKIRMKIKVAEEIGIQVVHLKLPS